MCRVNGRTMLTGLGLAADDEAGMTTGGGIHSERMRRVCSAISEDREMELYSDFRDAKTSSAFTREQCIEERYCTGDEDEGRYKMHDYLSESDGVQFDYTRLNMDDVDKKKKKKKKRNKRKKKKGNKKKKRTKPEL